MVSSSNNVNQKSVKNVSQLQYDQYGKKIWNNIRNIGNKVISIFKSNPDEFQSTNHSSITPTQTWIHDSVRMNLR